MSKMTCDTFLKADMLLAMIGRRRLEAVVVEARAVVWRLALVLIIRFIVRLGFIGSLGGLGVFGLWSL